MDEYASILLSFPPEPIPSDNVTYDKAVKGHLNRISHILKEKSADLIQFGPQLLEVSFPLTSVPRLTSYTLTDLRQPQLLNPAVNSLSYLAVLHTLLLPSPATSVPREFLLEKLVEFMLRFDAIQIRYAGSHLQDVFAAVGNGQLLPVSRAQLPAYRHHLHMN